MKWLEIIELRSVNRDRILNELGLMNLIAELDLGSRPHEIKMYVHGTIETDMSVNLIYDSENVDTRGSSLGLRLVSTLKKFGLVNHSVWVERPEFADWEKRRKS